MTQKKIKRIRIDWSDNTTTEILDYQLMQLEELSEAMSFIERAQAVYQQLKSVFKE